MYNVLQGICLREIMIQITRRLEFDAGHRLVNHEGKCRHLHGHRYIAEITCEAPGLDSVGRVIDFSVVKEKVGGWIDQHWDHNTILNDTDSLCVLFANEERKPFLFRGYNPTAENMAEYLYRKAKDLLTEDYGIKVVSVLLYETPNCSAFYKPE